MKRSTPKELAYGHYTHQNIRDLQVFFSHIVAVSGSVTIEFISDGELMMHPSLDSNLEEADIRIISHYLDFVSSGLTSLVNLSNVTDFFMIATHFF